VSFTSLHHNDKIKMAIGENTLKYAEKQKMIWQNFSNNLLCFLK